MKKIICLIILKFFLFTATTAIAGCNDDTDRSWSWTKSSNLTWDMISQTSKFQYTTKQNARYMVWTFKNKTNNKITIKRIGLYAKGNQTVMKERKVDLYLKPFGVRNATMYVGDLNLDVSASGFSTCIYGGVPKKSSDRLFEKPSNKKKFTYKKSKRNEDNFTLFNLFLLVVSGILIFTFIAATKKNEYKSYVKNFPIIFDFTDNTITCFKKYSTFSGKASRKEFWYFYLFTVIVSILTYFIDISIFNKDPDGILFINTFFTMVTFLPTIAAGCRRLHDVNKSGWWQLLTITVIGLIPLIIWLSSKPVKEKNKY